MLESIQNFSHLGQALSLGSALLWAGATIFFRIAGRSVHPFGLNFLKSLISILLFTVTIVVIGEPLFPDVPLKNYGLMLLSGAIGIGVSDSLFFASLNRLGAGLSGIVNTSYSPFVIFLSVLFLGEHMSVVQLLGVLLIIVAVLAVSRKKTKIDLPRRDLVAGIILGLFSMFFNAVGIVIMKPVLNSSSILWTALIRITGGFILLTLMISLHPRRHSILAPLLSLNNWRAMIPGIVLGGYVTFVAWTGGMKYIQASEASALNQTNTIFVFILGMIFLKEQAPKEKIMALFMAVAGVFLITLFP